MQRHLSFFFLANFTLAMLSAESAPPPPATTPPTTSPPTSPASPPASKTTDTQVEKSDDLFEMGQALFDRYAPAEIKDQYAFPDKAQFDAFLGSVERAVETDSFEELAAYEPQARAALANLEKTPGYEGYAIWLREQIDLMTAANQIVHPPVQNVPPPDERASSIPHYALWLKRLQDRPPPPGAEKYLPALLKAFAAEGLPPELAWLAEVESTFDPTARSPSGARGLFQLMPATAKELGLSTVLPDERTDPAKSARAAARLLRELHDRFGNWQLALAAYHAGAGRVSRAMVKEAAKDFAKTAPSLPAETRLYVPKVLATIAVRTGMTPESLAAPR